MPIRIEGDLAVLSGGCAVEEAEPLLEWARGCSGTRVDLSACTHLHAAVLQVLMAVQPQVVAASADPFVARVCGDILSPEGGNTGGMK